MGRIVILGTALALALTLSVNEAEAKLQRTKRGASTEATTNVLPQTTKMVEANTASAEPVAPAEPTAMILPTPKAEPQSDSVTVAAAANDGPMEQGGLSGQSTVSTERYRLRDHITASYLHWIQGPKFSAMDGAVGPGRNLLLDQYASLGYRFGKTWKVSVTQNFQNMINNDGVARRATYFNDPYVTLNTSSLWADPSRGLNLSTYIRYYVPISHESADRVGQATDQKNGKLRMKIDPTWSVLDGALTFSAATFLFKPLPGADANEATPEQRDFYVYFYPRATYKVSEKFAPYVAWSTTFQHFRQVKSKGGDGRWTKFTDDRNLELGFDYYPIASLDINPYINYGPKLTIPETSVGLIVEWAFL